MYLTCCFVEPFQSRRYTRKQEFIITTIFVFIQALNLIPTFILVVGNVDRLCIFASYLKQEVINILHKVVYQESMRAFNDTISSLANQSIIVCVCECPKCDKWMSV